MAIKTASTKLPVAEEPEELAPIRLSPIGAITVWLIITLILFWVPTIIGIHFLVRHHP